MKVLISGYYGFKNTGDELILRKIIEDVRSLYPNSEITVWSGNPEYTEKIHKVNAVNRFSVDDTIRAVSRSDCVIVGGGGLIHDYFKLDVKDIFLSFGYNVAAYSIVPLLAKIYEKPVFFWTHGVGPLFSKDSERFCKWFYSLADLTTVRDPFSYSLLKKLTKSSAKIYEDIDPVLKLNVADFINSEPVSDGKIRLGINLRPWFNESVFLTKLANVLRNLLEVRKELIILPIPFDLSQDVKVLEALISLLPGDRVEKEIMFSLETPDDVILAVQQTDLFIATRLHSLILAYLLEKPVLSIVYDRKVELEAERLNVPKLSCQ